MLLVAQEFLGFGGVEPSGEASSAVVVGVAGQARYWASLPSPMACLMSSSTLSAVQLLDPAALDEVVRLRAFP